MPSVERDAEGLPVPAAKRRKSNMLTVRARPELWEQIEFVRGWVRQHRGIVITDSDAVHFMGAKTVEALQAQPAAEPAPAKGARRRRGGGAS